MPKVPPTPSVMGGGVDPNSIRIAIPGIGPPAGAYLNFTSGHNMSRDHVTNGAIPTVSGTLLLFGGFYVPSGVGIATIGIMAGSTAAVSPTHHWACIVTQADLKVQAVSADKTTTAFNADSSNGYNMSSVWTPASDTPIYFGWCCVATTMPTLAGTAALANSVNNVQFINVGNSNTGLTTPLAVGTTCTALTANNNGKPYCWIAVNT